MSNFWDIEMEELCATDYLGIKRHAFRSREFGYWLGYIGIPLLNIRAWYPLYRQMKQQGCWFGKLSQVTFAGFFHNKLPFGYYWIGFDCAHNYNCLPFATQRELAEGEYVDAGDVLMICDGMIEQIRGVISFRLSEDNFAKITKSAIKFGIKKIPTGKYNWNYISVELNEAMIKKQ